MGNRRERQRVDTSVADSAGSKGSRVRGRGLSQTQRGWRRSNRISSKERQAHLGNLVQPQKPMHQCAPTMQSRSGRSTAGGAGGAGSCRQCGLRFKTRPTARTWPSTPTPTHPRHPGRGDADQEECKLAATGLFRQNTGISKTLEPLQNHPLQDPPPRSVCADGSRSGDPPQHNKPNLGHLPAPVLALILPMSRCDAITTVSLCATGTARKIYWPRAMVTVVRSTASTKTPGTLNSLSNFDLSAGPTPTDLPDVAPGISFLKPPSAARIIPARLGSSSLPGDDDDDDNNKTTPEVYPFFCLLSFR